MLTRGGLGLLDGTEPRSVCDADYGCAQHIDIGKGAFYTFYHAKQIGKSTRFVRRYSVDLRYGVGTPRKRYIL